MRGGRTAQRNPRCVSGDSMGWEVTQRSQLSGRGGRGSRGLFVSHRNRASVAVGGWFVLVLLGRAVEVHACGAGATVLGVSGLDCCSSGACVCVPVWVHGYWLRAVYRDGSEGLTSGLRVHVVPEAPPPSRQAGRGPMDPYSNAHTV